MKTILSKASILIALAMLAAAPATSGANTSGANTSGATTSGAIKSGASASEGHARLVPSPDCIQTILNQDTAVPATDCLTELDTINARQGIGFDGVPYPIADTENDRYRMLIHYTAGNFPDAALANWPLSIELNTGGSGWFSYLLVLVESRDRAIAAGFVQPAGDRCNDGYARWDRFSENGNGIYRRAATPFRLINPLDETNWRAVENAMLFEGKDETAQREEMLALASPPLYQDWLPYRELDNCAACCIGEIVVMQNMIGTEIAPGRDYDVLGVVLNRQAVADLATSDKPGDRCLAAGLAAAADRADPNRSDDDGLFLFRESWLDIRNGLATNCDD